MYGIALKRQSEGWIESMGESGYLDRKVETASLSEVRKLQEAKLAKQLDYLFACSLFYQEKFRAAGMHRKNYRRVARFAALSLHDQGGTAREPSGPPASGKAHRLRREERHPRSQFDRHDRPAEFVGLTRRDAKMWTRLTARSFYTQGLRKADIVIHAAGLTLFVAGLSSKDAIESVGAMFVPIGTGASEKALMAIQLLGATAMHCTPSYATYFAEWIRREAGLDPRELGLKKLFCGAEPGAGIPSVRARLQEDWGARVTEGLGNANMAPIIFSECPDQSGMHFDGQEYVLVEIVDPKRKPPLNSVSGELVHPSLERDHTCCDSERERPRDRARDEACPCGRTHPRLRCIGKPAIC